MSRMETHSPSQQESSLNCEYDFFLRNVIESETEVDRRRNNLKSTERVYSITEETGRKEVFHRLEFC
jgi:hypothetical protein